MATWAEVANELRLKLRPIGSWPGKQRSFRQGSRFSAAMKSRLATLKRELSMLGAKNIALQIAVREQDIRLDGLPRANAIATHPGVILALDSRYGPLRVYHDGFARWEDNLYAIALHLENLRHASLHGVGRDGQQYAGWKALPSGTEASGFKSAEDAARFIQSVSEIQATVSEIVLDRIVRANAYRAAAARLHPDQGGDHERFILLQQAKEILEKVA